MKRHQSLPALTNLPLSKELPKSVDVLNSLIKPSHDDQLTKIKEREVRLRTVELFGPEAERKRLGVLKYHMKKRKQRLDQLDKLYLKEFNEIVELMDLSCKSAISQYQNTDDGKKKEIILKASSMRDKNWLSSSNYSMFKSHFDTLTSQIVEKNGCLENLKQEINGIIAHYIAKINECNQNYIQELKKVPFLEPEKPEDKEKEILEKTHIIISEINSKTQRRLLDVQSGNQSLLSNIKKYWDDAVPEWKSSRYHFEHERFEKFVGKICSVSSIQDYFISINEELIDLYGRQEEMMRKIVYCEPRSLFSPAVHQELYNTSSQLFIRNKDILDQSKRMIIRCEADMNEEKEVLVEKFSQNMAECGLKSLYQVHSQLDEFFVNSIQPLFSVLAKNYTEAQLHCQKNHDLMTQLLVMISRIIEQEMNVKEEIESLFDKGNHVFVQIKDALEHIRNSIKKDMQELRDKMSKANTRKMTDAVLGEFGNLMHTFEDDTKNLRDQMMKMIHGQQLTITELLDTFHSRLCQVLEIQSIKHHTLVRTSSKNNMEDDRGHKIKCLPPLAFDHHNLDTSLNTIVSVFESKFEKFSGHRGQTSYFHKGKKVNAIKKSGSESNIDQETVKENPELPYIHSNLISPEILDQVKLSLQTAVIRWFEAIYNEFDGQFYDWKNSGLRQVESWMDDLAVFVKQLQIELESLYRKAIYEIEENDIYKSKYLQATITKLNNHTVGIQGRIQTVTEKCKSDLKDITEYLGQKIYTCLKQERHLLKDFVDSRLSNFEQKYEKIYNEMLSSFNEFEISVVTNDALLKSVEKCKKSIQERIKWFSAEMVTVKDNLSTDLTKRIEYLEFWDLVLREERGIRMLFQSNWLKSQNQITAIVDRIQKVEYFKKDKYSWEKCVNLFQEIHEVQRSLVDNVNYFSQATAPSILYPRPFISFSEYKSSANSSSRFANSKKVEPFVISQELLLRKIHEKLNETSVEFYKQKFQMKCLDGIPNSHSEYWTGVESRINSLRVENEQKRIEFSQEIQKQSLKLIKLVDSIQDWILSSIEIDFHSQISGCYQIGVKNYQSTLKKAWQSKKEENIKQTATQIEGLGSELIKNFEKEYEKTLSDISKILEYVSFIIPILQETNISKEQDGVQTKTLKPVSSQVFKNVKLGNYNPQILALFNTMDLKIKQTLTVADSHIIQENNIIQSLI